MVPTMESPEVMGLMGIHDPDALWHYAGYTYCPWCGKEGQNEGTVVNHLRTTHYRLGLVCNQCFGCPTVMSDSLCWHGLQNCQWYCVASGSGLSNWLACQTTSSFTREWRQCYPTRPPSPLKARRFDAKKALPASLPNPIFVIHPASPTNTYFYFSCDRDCLRKTLLITAKVVFIKVHQNNNSKQLNKHV